MEVCPDMPIKSGKCIKRPWPTKHPSLVSGSWLNVWSMGKFSKKCLLLLYHHKFENTLSKAITNINKIMYIWGRRWMKPSVEGSAVWRREQGEPVSHLTLTSSDSAPAGPRWNAEGREATDDQWSIYTDLVKKHGKFTKEQVKGPLDPRTVPWMSAQLLKMDSVSEDRLHILGPSHSTLINHQTLFLPKT